jgi:hypothetical protein
MIVPLVVTATLLRTAHVGETDLRSFFRADFEPVVLAGERPLVLCGHSVKDGLESQLLAEEVDDVQLPLDPPRRDPAYVAQGLVLLALLAPAESPHEQERVTGVYFLGAFAPKAEHAVDEVGVHQETQLEEVVQHQPQDLMQGAEESADVADELQDVVVGALIGVEGVGGYNLVAKIGRVQSICGLVFSVSGRNKVSFFGLTQEG